jgi:ABC-type transport system substrate-binding protein
MTLKGKWTLFLVVAVALLLVITGCGGGAAPPPVDNGDVVDGEPRVGGDLVIGLDWEPDPVIDPYKLGWGNLPIDLFEGLLISDFDFNPGPGIAESYTFEEEGLVQIYKIREDIYFHDGTKIDAEAVKRHFELLIDEEVDSMSRWDFAFISSMEVLDEYTLKVNLDNPFPAALSNFSWAGGWGGIQNPYAWEEYGPFGANTYGTEVVVGSGPFKFVEWIPGDRMVMERFDDYKSTPLFENPGPAYLDTVTYRFIFDSSTAVMEFEVGNVHILETVPPEFVEQVRNMPGANIYEGDSWEVVYVGMACDKAPFDDVRVRQALNLAVDQQEIADVVWMGYADPAYAYVSPSFGDAYVADKETFGFDPERAKELLAEAGYPDGFTVELAVENRTDWVSAAEIIQDMLAQVGVTVEIRQYERAGFYDLLRAEEQDMFIRAHSWWGLDILPWYFHSRNFPYPNYHRYVNEEMDARFDDADYSATYDEMVEKYKAIQVDLAKEAIWIPLVQPSDIVAYRDEVQNFSFHPLYGIRYNVDVWLSE